MNRLDANKKASAVILFIFICVSVFILLQSPLSPIGNGVPGTDSSIFVYMAETMLDGQPLYVAAWDHKGPLQYIIDGLGLLIAPGYTGIWLLEVISMVFSMVFVYKALRLELNRSLSLAGILSLFTLVVATLEGGNLTEEFALPFICAGFYICMLYFKHKRANWLLCGLCLAAVVLLKLNYAFLWVVFVPLVIVDMAMGRDRRIVIHALSFLLGMVILILPVGVYLALTDSFHAMIDAYFVFNFTYAGGASLYDIVVNGITVLARVDIAGVHVALTIGSVFVFAQLITRKDPYTKKILLTGILLLNVFGLICMAISGKGYAHYYIPLLVLLIYPVTLFLKALDGAVKNKRNGKKTVSALLVCVIVLGTWLLPLPYNAGRIMAARREVSKINRHYAELIKANTDAEDTIQIIGNRAPLYLLSGRRASGRFMFFPPDDFMETPFYQDNIMAETKEQVSSGIPRVVIVVNEALLPAFSAELEARYVEIEENVFVAK